MIDFNYDIDGCLRGFFGPEIDTWTTDKKHRVLVLWIWEMKKAGNKMMLRLGRDGIGSPAEAIAFDSPKSFLANFADYIPS